MPAPVCAPFALVAGTCVRAPVLAVDALNARTNSGGTPLHIAVTSGQPRMVSLLLAQEATDRGACDGEGNSAINIACARGELALLDMLLNTGRGVHWHELTVRNVIGWAALHTSAFRGQDAAVQMLLRRQAPVDQPTADGWSALHLASAEGHRAVTRSLLAGGAAVDMRHPSGESALAIAASRGHHGVVSELLGAGAAPEEPTDRYGWTPMHAALQHGDPSVTLAVLQGGGRLRAKAGVEPHAGAHVRTLRDARPWCRRAGDAIDFAHGELRRLALDADSTLRAQRRLAGHDLDSEHGDEGSDERAWPPSMAPGSVPYAWGPYEAPVQVMPGLPGAVEPMPPPRLPGPDRSGYFGHFPAQTAR